MSSLLQGGRRRGRLRTRLALGALVLALAAAGGFVYQTVLRDDEEQGDALPVRAAPANRSHSRVLKPETVPDVRVSGIDAFRFAFRKPPRAALLWDLRTGEALWSRNPRARLPIASLTKIMTAVLAAERAAPNERVMITREALRYQGSGVGVLPKGRRVSFEALLNGLMIQSGNDAAIALAVHVAGSQRRFVRHMNRTAQRLGLRCTHFVDSHGLDPGNRSCARDLAVMSRLAMGNRRVARVVNRRQVSVPFPVKGGQIVLSTHNPLFRSKYRGAIGLKTGFTDEAGRCFVGVARRARRTLGVVLLDSPNPPKHAPALLDQGFRHG